MELKFSEIAVPLSGHSISPPWAAGTASRPGLTSVIPTPFRQIAKLEPITAVRAKSPCLGALLTTFASALGAASDPLAGTRLATEQILDRYPRSPYERRGQVEEGDRRGARGVRPRRVSSRMLR